MNELSVRASAQIKEYQEIDALIVQKEACKYSVSIIGERKHKSAGITLNARRSCNKCNIRGRIDRRTEDKGLDKPY